MKSGILSSKWLTSGLLAVFFASFALIGGCTKKSPLLDQALQDQVLYLGNGTEVQGLDPHNVTGVPEHKILMSLLEGLVTEDPVDLHPVPGVAESWVATNDLKTYTFKLRTNAKWSNGDPVTAQDFEFSWKRALTPTLAAENAYMLYFVKNAKAYNEGKIKDFSLVGAKAIDDHTFRVDLESPTPYFLSVLSHYITWPVHRGTIEKFGKFDQRGTEWTRAGNFVGNGPFALAQWELHKTIVVKKNTHYWDANQVKLSAIHFFPTENTQSEERSFRNGELHVTEQLIPNKIDVYKKENPDLLQITPYLGSYFYLINVNRKPFNDKRVRKALSYSIDREKIVTHILRGGQLPAYGLTPPNTAGYQARAKSVYDLSLAKKLLAEAGYPEGRGFPKFEILYNTNEAHRSIAEAIQQMWKVNLGLDVSLTNQEWKVYLDNQNKKNYDVSRRGWIGDYNDPNTFLDLFISSSGNNNAGFKDAAYDSLINKAASTVDPNTRMEVFQEAEKFLIEEMPFIPIYFYTRVYLKSKDVQGWHSNILDHHPYKYVYLKR